MLHKYGSRPGYAPYARGPRTGKIADALETILSGAPVSATVLKTVLECSERPEGATALRDHEIIPACMRILQQYRSEGPILRSEKGILCLRVLSRSFKAGLLVHETELFPYAAPIPINPNQNLTDYIISLLQAHVRSQEEIVYNARVPRPLLTPWLTMDNTTLLLTYLYEERIRLFADRRANPNNWKGFSVLLYGMWAHMRARGGIDPGTMGTKLRDIACRFALVESSYKDEERLTTSMIVSLKNIIGGSPTFDPDAEEPLDLRDPEVYLDSIAVVKFYNERMSRSPPPLSLSLHLFEWTTEFAAYQSSDLMLAHFQVSYARLWNTLNPAKENPTMTPDRMHDIVDYMAQLVHSTS